MLYFTRHRAFFFSDVWYHDTAALGECVWMALVSLIYSQRKIIHFLSALEKQHCLCQEWCQENSISKYPLDLMLYFFPNLP